MPFWLSVGPGVLSLRKFKYCLFNQLLWEISDRAIEDSVEIEVDLVEAVEDLVEEVLAVAKESLMAQERCMMPLAVNAESNVKFHLDQLETNLCFAVNVLEIIIQETVLVQEMVIHLQILEFPKNNLIRLTPN